MFIGAEITHHLVDFIFRKAVIVGVFARPIAWPYTCSIGECSRMFVVILSPDK
jgi:hypothetical protein